MGGSALSMQAVALLANGILSQVRPDELVIARDDCRKSEKFSAFVSKIARFDRLL